MDPSFIAGENQVSATHGLADQYPTGFPDLHDELGVIASASFFFLNHESLLHEFQTTVRAAPNVQDQARHDRITPGQP